MLEKSRLGYLALVTAALALAAGTARPQDYPTKPLRIVVPSSPGQLLDIAARVMGPEMSKSLGQPVIVENKTGASQLIGYEHVARQSPADGYTMATVNVPGLATLPVTTKDLRFDPLKDLPPFLVLGEGRITLGSSSKLPWKSFAELVAYAKANPGKLNYGTSSVNARLATEALVRDLAIQGTHVPYPAAGPYVQALATGEVHMGLISDNGAIGLGDRFRVLAVSGEERRPPFLDVPTFKELHYPQIRGLSFSLNVRSGTPKAALDKLRAAGLRALQQPEVKATMAKLQLQPVSDTPEEAAKRLAEEASFFAEMAKKVGIQAK